MGGNAWTLAIDFGTSFSAACITDASGTTVVEMGGQRRMPSCVLLGEDGSLVAGPAAAHQAHLFPDRVDWTPKQAVGRDTLLLGGRAVPVSDAVGAVLAALLSEARRLRGDTWPDAVVLTHPARWDEVRRAALTQAAVAAGIADPVLVSEPVAAASHYLRQVPDGANRVAVYDLGGGTFDTAVLEWGAGGLAVVGQPGGDQAIGGEAFDHRLFEIAGAHLADRDPATWERLRTSTERKWQRAAGDLRRQVVQAKEVLSVQPTATVYVPEADADVLLTRAELERVIADDVARTVDELEDTLDLAGVTQAEVDAVYLAGGSSRIPLVGTAVQERFDERVQTWDDPKCVVAMGAAAAAGLAAAGPGSPGTTAPIPPPVPPPPGAPSPHDVTAPLPAPPPGAVPPPPPGAVPPPPPDGGPPNDAAGPNRRLVLIGAVAAFVLVVAGVVTALLLAGGDDASRTSATVDPGRDFTSRTTATEPEPTTTEAPPTTAAPPGTAPSSNPTLAPSPDTFLGAPRGLFCRDLNARGFSFADAHDYWVWDGSPDRMDADLNGIPCETVYPAEEVSAFFGDTPASADSFLGAPRGLFCRDLNDRGFTYAQAHDYWVWDGSPDRMDADLNGIPCETVYPASEVDAFFQ